MNHFYQRRTTFEHLSEIFLPSNSPQLDIKFHFIFKSLNKLYILNQNQPRYWRLDSNIPSYDGVISAAAAGGSPPPPDRVAWAVRSAVAGRLLEAERRELIELVSEAIEALPERGALHLYFEVSVEHRHVYTFFGGGARVVPASTKAFEQLEYEVDRARDDVANEEERCCCICLEEIGGGGGGRAARMPCKHVFHGGCIKKWLRKSHCCPLCRYEMPTE